MFADREDAGRALAAEIGRIFAAEPKLAPPTVLALPRGGVPVAFEIARALDAPLDLVLVRKIGAPGWPELAAGAVVDADPPELVVNRSVTRDLGVTEAALEEIKRTELEEIARRRQRYLGGRARAPVEGRTVIVADDGAATGATALAALRALRRRGVAHLMLALPVAPPDTVARLRPAADRIVCLQSPDWFAAVGQFYRDFGQTPDEEVIRLLDAAAQFGKGTGRGGN